MPKSNSRSNAGGVKVSHSGAGRDKTQRMKFTFYAHVKRGQAAYLNANLGRSKKFSRLGSFVMVSRLELFNLGIQRDLAGAMPYCVLLHLASCMGYNNTFSCTVEELAEELHRNERVVRRALDDLTRHLVLRKLKGGGSSTTYFVNPWVMARGRHDWVKRVQEAWSKGHWPPEPDEDPEENLSSDQEKRGLKRPPRRTKKSAR